MRSFRFVCSIFVVMCADVMIALTTGASAQVAQAGREPLHQFDKVMRFDSGGLGADSVAIADVNGDGKLDIVVANFDQNDQTESGGVSVLLGNGDGTFQPAISYSSVGWGASSVAIADVNGDGKPDIIVTNWCLSTANCAFGGGASEGSVSVLLGNGDGTFQPAVSYDTGADQARSVAVGDFNGDGKLDLAVANSCGTVDPYYSQCLDTGKVSILPGNGDGTFRAPVVFDSDGYYANTVAVSDLDRDGLADVVVVNSCQNTNPCDDSVVAVLLSNGDGTFQPATGYVVGLADAITIGDVNGDGIPDLVVPTVYVLLGNGDGTFQAPVYYFSGATGPNSVAIADMNGDGFPDLVVGDAFPCFGRCELGVYVMLGRGDGSFYEWTSHPAGGTDTESVAVADLNGDGKPDVVAANYYPKPNSRWTNDGIVGVLLNTFITETGTHVKSSLNPSHVDQSVTFTSTVISSSSSVPNGSVITFYDGATQIGTGTTTNGVATLTTSFPAAGKYTIEASYPGDLFHEASSGKVKQVVKP